MLKSKRKKREDGSRVAPNVPTLPSLPREVLSVVSEFLTVQEIAPVALTSKKLLFFQQQLDQKKQVHPLLSQVVRGNVESVLARVQAKPDLLFIKGQITDVAGQTFYHVSPYQLILLLCDEDLKVKIESLIPQDLQAKRTRQLHEMDGGGADLVKIDCDPTTRPFAEITQYAASYSIPDEDYQAETVFSLLENRDGIIYYHDVASDEVRFYYANQDTQQVELIKTTVTDKDNEQFAAFTASLQAMEKNSSKRSSNTEHRLIARTMKGEVSGTSIKLERKGIQYQREGIRYCDTRIDFNRLINAYRKCLRLYQEGKNQEADSVCLDVLGMTQRDVVWLLQRYCERDTPFTLLPDFAALFTRQFLVENYLTSSMSSLWVDGKLDPGLGVDFALFKIGSWCAIVDSGAEDLALLVDLIAVNALIIHAKAAVLSIESEQPSQNRIISR